MTQHREGIVAAAEDQQEDDKQARDNEPSMALLPTLLKAFPQWSHQCVSILPRVLAASAGISVLPVGWLIDRIEARVVTALGAFAAGAAFILASRSHSRTPMITIYLLAGLSIAAGKLIMGYLADRLTARNRLGLCFLVQAIDTAMVFSAANSAMIVLFVVVYGLTVPAPLMLLPLITAESLGLKRFGFIAGMTGLAQTFGAAAGPLVAGHIFDVTSSYIQPPSSYLS
jgi:sugar phosphate permease